MIEQIRTALRFILAMFLSIGDNRRRVVGSIERLLYDNMIHHKEIELKLTPRLVRLEFSKIEFFSSFRNKALYSCRQSVICTFIVLD